MFQVKSTNAEDQDALLTLLFSLGYKYSGVVDNVKDAHYTYGRFGYPALVITPDTKSIGGNHDFRENRGDKLTLPQDFTKIVDSIFELAKTIEIKGVGDYSAIVSREDIKVGSQTISHEKFQEIVAALAEVKK